MKLKSMSKLSKAFLIASSTLFSMLPFQQKAQAQLVPPSTPDLPWYSSSSNYIAGLNTAMIYIDNAFSGGPDALMVSSYYGNGNAGGVAFMDKNSGFTQQVDYTAAPPYANAYMSMSPDIIVGNFQGMPQRAYVTAAAYVYTDPFSGATNPQIDYYLVYYTTPATFLVQYMGTTKFQGFHTYTVHLDIIAESGNTMLTGYPWSNHFVVTWDDVTSGGDVYSIELGLNPPATSTVISPFTPGVRKINPPGLNGIQPDVAAIQRQACGACPVKDMALITYTNSTVDQLYCDEWDIPGSTVTPGVIGPVFPAIPPYYTPVQQPRIDAPDDYTINNPMPGRSYYKVAAQVYNNSYTFDNLLGASYWDNATPFVPGNQYSPTVAFGQRNCTQYTISHVSDNTGSLFVYAEPIDWMMPANIAPAPSSALNWFRVTNSPFTWFVGAKFNNAICTPCNNPSAYYLTAWANWPNAMGTSDVFYKVNSYMGPTGYNFKPGNPNMVTDLKPQTRNVYPVPATSSITLEGQAGDDRYTISDVTGRIVLNGVLNATTQAIDINSLASGNYNINTYAGQAVSGNAKFIKQ